MEEKKLLRILIGLIISGTALLSIAEESIEDWAMNLAKFNQQASLDNIKDIMDRAEFDQNLRDEVINPRPALQIFVSSSMPKALLKNYALEAKKYGGVLVFRGLPDGSVHKFTEYLMDIVTEETSAMQIDDEAFAAFGINSVPAIVLSKPETIFSKEKTEAKFDKVIGNITIKAALELFAGSGDMQSSVKKLLR
jgi:type-F conjugative transfer system pilin assembly protein TrbC